MAAAGNDSKNNDTTPSYPAGYDLPNVISVASTDDEDKLSWFSNYGVKSVDVAAPGSAVMSTIPKGAWGLKSGTSMAAPQVAGVAMLIQGVCPGRLSMQNIKRAILENGKRLSSLKGKVVNATFVDAMKAVDVAETLCSATLPAGDFTPAPVEGAPPPASGTEVPRWTPLPTNAPTRTATPTRTITPTPLPTRSPTPKRTPQPTATPRPTFTPVPTKTPIPTPSQAPTPIPLTSVKIPSTAYSAGSTVPVELFKGKTVVKQYSIRILAKDGAGLLSVCSTEPSLSIPQLSRTLSLKLSSPIEKFASIQLQLKGDGKSMALGTISLAATKSSASTADTTALCRNLAAQIN